MEYSGRLIITPPQRFSQFLCDEGLTGLKINRVIVFVSKLTIQRLWVLVNIIIEPCRVTGFIGIAGRHLLTYQGAIRKLISFLPFAVKFIKERTIIPIDICVRVFDVAIVYVFKKIAAETLDVTLII